MSIISILIVVAVLSSLLWPFAEGVWRGYYAIPHGAQEDQVRKAKIGWFAVASVVAVAWSLLFAQEPAQVTISSKKVEDPCLHNRDELTRQYPTLKSLSVRQARAVVAHGLRTERLELELKGRSLDCQPMVFDGDVERYVQCSLKNAEYERKMRQLHAQSFYSMLERQDVEWKMACDQVLREGEGVATATSGIAVQDGSTGRDNP